MSKSEDDGLKDLLDPKSLLEQLRECETKQFRNVHVHIQVGHQVDNQYGNTYALYVNRTAAAKA